MNEDLLESIWKATVLAYPGFSWRDWEKKLQSLSHVSSDPAEFRKEHLANTDLEHYR
jgi:hypothetical protein